METQNVTLKDLAAELGMDRSHCRKFVLSMGIETFPVRLVGARGSPLSAVTRVDAEKIRLERRTRGFHIPADEPLDSTPSIASKCVGSFYVVALDPKARPGRLKFGYAQNVQGRLVEHRCAAPTAELLGAWPAKRSWEPCIMAALSLGATQVGAEVFDVEDVDVVLDKADRFMEMLGAEKSFLRGEN